ncbi:prepilin-type N-terminal cleavage/methylation domain-containing protein [Isachenkonia alkalipeptolytica]|uniref:Prepilin-type N-terminal cleavage/methylation domain-containing protein n=1 Tax=Isachenkonia alkalipeptolytica TaxID=2565777 RepID=A0AA43XLY5_9CLOT|nr:prepilin-type N-terminal cleavage/methylation domain-containing protein [Isachenkonia alkalipeptolytica]NBG88791.1 prepilin-type N-terminal cleavage/methylation domain-containing protein [Isachenkonia alkalipeptolytica]
MKIRNRLDSKGFTLLELMLTLLLSSLLILTYATIVLQSVQYWQYHIEQVRVHENLQYALHYIEKNIRQFNQQEIQYIPDMKQIISRNSQGELSYMDFSGENLNQWNTYLYYQKGNRRLLINRKRENNVLAQDIDQLIIKEVQSGALIEVSISSKDTQGKEHTLKSQIRISPRR